MLSCAGSRNTIVAAALVAAALAGRANPQTIDLSRDIQPPALPSPSLAATIVGVLEREAAELNAAAAGASDRAAQMVMTACANLRLLAAERLAAGDRAGAAGSVMVIQGLKLAVQRDALDHRLNSRSQPSAESVDLAARALALDAVAAFNRGWAEHVQRGDADARAATQPDQADWFVSLLARLLPLATDDAGNPEPTHWIVLREGENPAAASQPQDSETQMQALRRRAVEVFSDEAVRAELASILDFLERGRQFADLAPRVVQYQQAIGDLLQDAAIINDATWLEAPRREALLTRVRVIISRFSDPAQRQRGLEETQRLNAWADVIAPATILQQDNVDDKTLRAIIAGLETLESARDERETSRAMAQTATVLERMAASRSWPPSSLTRELRITERNLAREYREVEAKLLKEMAAGVLLQSTMADPGVASLLADHRERLEDLQQLRRMPDWSAAINRIHPPAAKPFDAQMRARANDLLVPTRRPEARLALSRFERDLALFDRLPFEQSLQDATPAAMQLTGGLQNDMFALVVARRRAWAEEWSRPEPAAGPSDALFIVQRLLQSLRDAAALVELEPEIINRWPAWQLSESLLAGGQSDVTTRLKLACAAAAAAGVEGDIAPLREQLDRIEIESPTAGLAGRLASALGNDLRERSGGAAGVLAQLAIAPAPDAAFLKHCDDLARIARYAAEAEHARDSGHNDAAAKCREYSDALAQQLVREVDMK